jgi:predicted metal-dependent hydrolase
MNSQNKILTSHTIAYGSTTIDFSLIQSSRKTFRIEVLPDRKVVVMAPHKIQHQHILDRVKKRGSWISKQIAYFDSFYPRITPRKYIS